MMNLEKSPTLLTEEDLDLLPYPAFLLNQDRLVTFRNKTVNTRLIPIRIHSRIDRYLSKHDRQKLIDLPIGQEIFVDMQMPDSYGAIVLRQKDGYCLAMRNITAHMIRHISDMAIHVPSFFGDVENQICNLRLATFRTPEEMRLVRRNYNRALRYQAEIATYFRITAGKLDHDTISEISTPVNTMLDCATKLLRPNGFRLSVLKTEAPVFARAAADDVRYAIATLLSIATENLRDERLRTECHILEGEYLISVTFEPLFDDQTYQGILSGYYREELLDSPYRNMFFDLLLVQMLAETSRWRFSVTEAGCSKGVLCMILAIPLAEQQPLMLNSPPDSMPLLEMQLVNVLGAPEEQQNNEVQKINTDSIIL